jgi:hypothetical protein
MILFYPNKFTEEEKHILEMNISEELTLLAERSVYRERGLVKNGE